MYPYAVERKIYHTQTDRYVSVPCGRCPECLKRRASVWSFRMRKEEERTRSAFFVTLTYDTKTIPISKNGFMTLDKRDVQLFFKRLRKATTAKYGIKEYPLKYYVAGEYGSEKKRPHYHAVIYNADELDILKSWVHPEKKIPYGNVDIGTVTGASVSYTIKYINKGRFKPMHANDDRVPEFSLMSKKLGSNYLTANTVAFHRGDLKKAYITVEDGIRIALPRYYKDKLFPITANVKLIEQHPSLLIHLQDNEKLRKQQAKIIQEIVESQPKTEMTDREIHESKRNAIQNFNEKYNKRKDF